MNFPERQGEASDFPERKEGNPNFHQHEGGPFAPGKQPIMDPPRSHKILVSKPAFFTKFRHLMKRTITNNDDRTESAQMGTIVRSNAHDRTIGERGVESKFWRSWVAHVANAMTSIYGTGSPLRSGWELGPVMPSKLQTATKTIGVAIG